MKKIITALGISCLMASSSMAQTIENTQKFEPTWESLQTYEVPAWWKNIKFGIYFHWGPYSVPAHDTEWYSHWMYCNGNKINKYHKEKYGDLKDFGYKDFIPMFTAEKFNANKWAKLFKKAGAQFAGPVAEHADGFAMWDSEITEWNSAKMGPKIDVVQEMQDAIKKQGLKFLLTFHRHWLYGWYPTYDKSVDAGDPKYAGLYGPYVEEGVFKMGSKELNAPVMAEEEFAQEWLDRLEELMTKYDPDIIWFDNKMNLIPEDYRKQFLADFYNIGQERNKDVVCTYKFNDLVEGTAVLDLERSRMKDKMPFSWLTDDSVDWGAWCHVEDHDYKTTNRLVDFLVDVVSKNGAVLLNITPTAQGVIPKEVERRLLEMGEWLDLNGEAIYDTRPWTLYGEGPQEIKEGHLSERQNGEAVAEDIRYTVNGSQLYATALDWPANGTLTIKTLASGNKLLDKEITKVSMLGVRKPLKFKQTSEGLVVTFPDKKPCDFAFVLKIN